MITMTPQIDPNKQLLTGPTTFMTERNEHEVRCGMCARPVYVDDETYRKGNESGEDDPYRCEICAEEYADVA
jgi:hypothetical protein